MAKISDLQKKTLSFQVFSTLAYADIFDFPLTASEVWRFLISDTKVTVEVIQGALKILTDSKRLPAGPLRREASKAGICADRGFYLLNGRREIVDMRKNRVDWSKQKLEIATKTAKKLKNIPGIKMVGITGALAMENCDEDDDIDLIIIASENLLWLTRMLIFLACPVLGIKRRKPGERNPKNKICFNLFLEENHLEISSRNLFTAHEIAQVKPILNKDKTYEKFLEANQWVSKFLPNGVKISTKYKVQSTKLGRKHSISQYPNILISFLDRLAFFLQYLYMKPKITGEKISLEQAFFHPRNLGSDVQEMLEERLKEYRV